MTRPPVPPTRDGQRLLRTSEVAALAGVDPRTVLRWAEAGKLAHTWTIGGHRRYHPDDAEALAAGMRQAEPEPPKDGAR
jgi:excisionase family DNA binding protein